MKILHLILYIAAYVGALLAATQAVAVPQCRIQRNDENDGLTQWHVTQMTQDGQGMMWFATWFGLQRKMKQVMGVSPLDFIKEARIKHACHLLSTTTMAVSDVAFACGYSDPKYFSRSFKESTGKSPKEWRA